MLKRVLSFVRQFGIAALISSAGSSIAGVIPFPVDTRYEHWQSSYYRSPTYQVATWSFHQINEPGKVKEFSEDSNFDEYAVRYGNFRSETTWWDSGISWAQTWQFGYLNYSGPANTTPVNLDPQLSSTYFSSGVEISSYSHYSMATLYVGDGNGAGWQPPRDPNVDPTILSESGDPSDIQPLKVTANAVDLASGNAIAKTAIQLNGENLDATGYKVFKTSAGQKFMAQVSVPGNNNIGISAFGETHPPRILIAENEWNWGDDISKSTTPVWAGQIITLACVLAPGVMGAPPVESYEWVVDGDAVKDVQLVNSNGFFKIPLTIKTNSTITFAWLGATPNPTVTCKVKIKGLEFSQKAFFQVAKRSIVVKDYKNGTINGVPNTATPIGIQLYRVETENDAVNGFLPCYGGYLASAVGQDDQIQWADLSFFQRIVSSVRGAWDTNGNQISGESWTIQNMHDNVPPYTNPDLNKIWFPEHYGTSLDPVRRGILLQDSPKHPIKSVAARTEVTDQFEDWAMHKAGEYPSTWVPVARATWFWHFVYWKGSDGIGNFSEKDWNTSPFEATNDLPTWNGYFVVSE